MSQQEIAARIAAAREYLSDHREEARYRDGAATAVIEAGLRAVVRGADGAEVATDMVPGVGGGGTAPSPGWLLRAASASCIATLIAMRAAELDVALDRLEVSVDSESDDFGILGLDDAVPAGPLSMRVVVQAASATTPDDVVREIVDWGVLHCPVSDAIRRPVPVEVEVRVG